MGLRFLDGPAMMCKTSVRREAAMIVGYARTSTIDQRAGLEAQERDLNAHGCERLFVEQVSSVDVVAREQLAQALDFIREGDTLVVTKLDRLARSVAHLLEVTERVKTKGANLRILDLAIDTSTATGELLLTMVGAVAQFERAIMLERQREGIAKAKAAGKYRGRKPTAQAKADDARRLAADGLRPVEIAARLGISRASAYRLLAGDAEHTGGKA
jgi:DNA invertase Pin-like site-specific DNA recombinase